jgi:NAD(P)-dependent dehydrogenase (short-subunit alcohol dehydrogenase family)
MSYFRNRVAVVTGAGSGIGRATAHLLAREGARVHAVDIRADRLEEACRPGITTHVVDCADAGAVEELARAVFAAEGRVDLLQNGVGVIIAGPVERLTTRQWRRALDLNLWSVIHGVQAFVPRMLEQSGARAHVCNIASVAGLVGFPYTAAYSASKAAVVGLSEALSAELHRRGVGVTCVCPGMVRTSLLADGELALPGRFNEQLRWFHDNLGPPPEPVARAILRAVKADRPLVAPALGFKAAWLGKRASVELYNRIVRQLMRLAPR